MYGVNDKMSQYSSREHPNPAPAKNAALSPELREVMHMLDALEQNATARNSDR